MSYTDFENVYKNSKLSSARMPKRDGYKAVWYKDREKTIPYDFSQPVTEDVNLYAKWEYGEDENPIWDGTSEEPKYNSETKTYYISNAKELAWISDVSTGAVTAGNNFPENINFSGCTVELVSDIIFDGTIPWKPINCFNGVFDGKNYQISGIKYSTNVSSLMGLFGETKSGSTIKNIYIKIFADFDASDCYGATLGAIAANNHGTIQSCYASSNSEINAQGSWINVGGIAGINHGKIIGCGNINMRFTYHNGTSGSIGGILGGSKGNSYITDCFSDGAIYSYTNGNVGGIVGKAIGTHIENCYFTGNVLGTSNTCVGGICGEAYGGSVITKCYSSNKYEFSADNSGLIAGLITSTTLEYCYAPSDANFNLYNEDYNKNNTISNVRRTNLKDIYNCYGFNTDKWTIDSSVNDGYPYLKDLESSYISYRAIINESDARKINRSISVADGIIYGESKYASDVGGLIGFSGNNLFEINSSISSVNKIEAKNSDNSGTRKGYLFGYGDRVNNSYYDADVELSISNSNDYINTVGTARSSRLIKMPSFLKSQFGLNEYKSVENLSNDKTAVWVIRDGEFPEIYYNCLNDITISNRIENGSVIADKTQAIDGETVTLSVNANDGYELNKVYVNGKEIAGTSFEMSGSSDIYATFKPVTPEYNVKVESNNNATASLVNNDESSAMRLQAADVTQLTAKDGEEIRVNASAAQNYTVDSVCVNGEEIAANSFIVTDNSTITLKVQSLSTDVKAVTYDATEVGPYFATLSGEVKDDNDSVKYIRYWKVDEPENVFVTEPTTESGIYSVTIMLDSDTEYKYQMLDTGEIKSFKTLSSDDGTFTEENVLTETFCSSSNGIHTFDVTAKKDINNKTVMLALYDSSNKLLCVKDLVFVENKASISINSPTCSIAKIFVWENKIIPLSVPEFVQVIK